MARPSEIKNLHERLGISSSASQEEIKSAYRKLAHQWHPDKYPGNEVASRLEFIAVSEAFKELSEEGRQYFGETKQSVDDSDLYAKYKEYFNIIYQANPELAKVWRMFVNPETLRHFNF